MHHQRLLVLKEDSPPVVLDPHTLDTLDDYYTFGGKLRSLTHTAHPKIDAVTGELVAFGYQATGLASNDVCVFSADRQGTLNWEAWIKVPYSGILHDFAVTQQYVVFFLLPLMTNMDLIRRGGLHYTWDAEVPLLRRRPAAWRRRERSAGSRRPSCSAITRWEPRPRATRSPWIWTARRVIAIPSSLRSTPRAARRPARSTAS